MKLYMSSYKLGNKVDELKSWIRVHDNQIVLFPNAQDAYPDGERKRQGIESDVDSLKSLGFHVTVISLRDYFTDSEKLRNDLKDFHAFFAIGGNAFVLRQAMKLSGFDNYLKELSSHDNYLYGGYSAGICILAPCMKGLELVDDPNANPYHCEPIFEGIGLVNYLPVPHFESNHPESEAVNLVVKVLQENGTNYRTLHDGDVFIEDTCEYKAE